MSLATPHWLWLLVPLAWFTVARWRSPDRSRCLAFPVQSLAVQVHPGLRRRAFSIRRALLPLGAGWLVIGLAGPRWDHEISFTTGSGVDALIVLDVSSSMHRTDLSRMRGNGAGGDGTSTRGTRLDIAREVIADFVRRRPRDRIGLTTFARFPRARCPLTTDHDALVAAIDAIEAVEAGSAEDQTGVGVAFATAVQQVAKSGATSRIVVLLTDGEETVHAVSSQEAAAFARELGVRVYTIAVGRRVGEWAEALRASSELTGGRGYVAHGAQELRGIYEEIDRLEMSDIEEAHRVYHTPLHAVAVLIGLALLICGPLLDATWFRRAP